MIRLCGIGPTLTWAREAVIAEEVVLEQDFLDDLVDAADDQGAPGPP